MVDWNGSVHCAAFRVIFGWKFDRGCGSLSEFVSGDALGGGGWNSSGSCIRIAPSPQVAPTYGTMNFGPGGVYRSAYFARLRLARLPPSSGLLSCSLSRLSVLGCTVLLPTNGGLRPGPYPRRVRLVARAHSLV